MSHPQAQRYVKVSNRLIVKFWLQSRPRRTRFSPAMTQLLANMP